MVANYNMLEHSSSGLRVALVQLNVGADPAANLAATLNLIASAASAGAQLVALPECANFIQPNRAALREQLQPLEQDLTFLALQEAAKRLGLYVLAGSLLVQNPHFVSGQDDQAPASNLQLLLDPAGQLVAQYSKINMFDAALPNGEVYRESALYQPGSQSLVTPLQVDEHGSPAPWKLGHSICFDLRYPELYRHYSVDHQANIMLVPAAFTQKTGEAYWQTLLRARAIETASYVLAPAQCGEHAGGRRTFGHLMIVDPWGQVLVQAQDRPTVIMADLDLSAVVQARDSLPSWGKMAAFTRF